MILLLMEKKNIFLTSQPIYGYKNVSIFMQMLWLSLAGTVECAFFPFVKKWIFNLCCELQWGGSAHKSLWNRYYLFSLAARPSFKTSRISNHLPGQRTGWRSTSPQTCAAYWKKMHFRSFFFQVGYSSSHRSSSASICQVLRPFVTRRRTHGKTWPCSVFTRFSRFFFFLKGMSRGFSLRIARQLAEARRADAITKGWWIRAPVFTPEPLSDKQSPQRARPARPAALWLAPSTAGAGYTAWVGMKRANRRSMTKVRVWFSHNGSHPPHPDGEGGSICCRA